MPIPYRPSAWLRRAGLTVVATAALVMPWAPAAAGMFDADFSSTVLDPLLVKSATGLRSTATVTSGGGALTFGYNGGSNYDYGVQKVITTFSVTGDFVARTTLTLTGIVQAGLEVFAGANPGAPNPNGSQAAIPTAASVYNNSNQALGYTRPNGYGSGLLTSTVVDLIVKRTGGLVEQFYNRRNGAGPVAPQPGFTIAPLSNSPVKLALFIANSSGAVTATFSDFEITSASVADSGPTPVPEPASLVLLGIGLAGVAASIKSRRTS